MGCVRKIKVIYILVPSFTLTGPVKGAIALANGLVSYSNVCLVSVKGGDIPHSLLNPQVDLISLAECPNFLGKVRIFKSTLATHQIKPTVISLCFSADMLSLCCSNLASTISSVRSNLIANYRMDYGLLGIGLALFHLVTLRCFNKVVAMTSAMSSHIKKYAKCEPIVIGNFIDEDSLEPFRQVRLVNEQLRIVFVGSLTTRKQPDLLLMTVKTLNDHGVNAYLDFVGDGPLRQHLTDMATRLDVASLVTIHGHISEPYHLIANADLMVLPSISEGVSRAVLESLYLGVPAVMRDVDGNAELITDYKNGMLFKNDEELVSVMLKAAEWARHREVNAILLPQGFRQSVAVKQYFDLTQQLTCLVKS